jgi:hypothetical protein
MAGRIRQQVLRTFVLSSLLLVSGCVYWPQFGPPPPVGPPYVKSTVVAVDSLTTTYSSADSAAAELNRLWLQRYRNGIAPLPPEEPPRRSAAGDSSPASTEGPAETAGAPDAAGGAAQESGTPAAEASADSLSAARSQDQGPGVSLELPVQDRRKLEFIARNDMAVADSLVQITALRTLPASERDKLETSLGLIKQGRDALTREDLQAAANLAYKARLLAEEVARR